MTYIYTGEDTRAACSEAFDTDFERYIEAKYGDGSTPWTEADWQRFKERGRARADAAFHLAVRQAHDPFAGHDQFCDCAHCTARNDTAAEVAEHDAWESHKDGLLADDPDCECAGCEAVARGIDAAFCELGMSR